MEETGLKVTDTRYHRRDYGSLIHEMLRVDQVDHGNCTGERLVLVTARRDKRSTIRLLCKPVNRI